jgi:hypothetical protein
MFMQFQRVRAKSEAPRYAARVQRAAVVAATDGNVNPWSQTGGLDRGVLGLNSAIDFIGFFVFIPKKYIFNVS